MSVTELQFLRTLILYRSISMSIYRKNYRKIWINHYGPIPKDEDGRTYDIHHIDGNRANNDINNLVAHPIKEHYDIHYGQGDWDACLIMSKRMKLSPEMISELASKALSKRNIENAKEGKHPSQTEKFRKEQSERVRKNNLRLSKEGKLFFQSDESKKLASNRMKDLYSKGQHPLQNEEHRKKMTESSVERMSKKYEITFPDGRVEVIRNLKKFCREMNLTAPTMVAVSKGRQTHHKGYKVKEIQL